MTALLLILALVAPAGLDAAAAAPQSQRSAEAPSLDQLRTRARERYEIIPLSNGVALRPKFRTREVGLIEIAEGAILINGTEMSGRELRSKLGTDADLVLQLSYLTTRDLSALAAAPGEPHPPETHEAEVHEPSPAAPGEPPIRRQHYGERVRLFGNIMVGRDEIVDGEVVAVFGSVRIDGEVDGEVVSVFGSIDLGPEARVSRDVTVVGGQLNRAPGAAVNGSVREIGLGFSPDFAWGDWAGPGPWWFSFPWFQPFSGTARLIGTTFRVLLLILLGAIVVLIARGSVERIAERVVADPLKVGIVGLLAELLFFPVLVLACVILAITFIGIPLLLLVPFVIVGMLFVFLFGFVGTAQAIGVLAARRLGRTPDQPYLEVALGIIILLSPLLLARLLGTVGGPTYFFGMLLAAMAFVAEYVAWTMGFGAALLQVFGRWQSRRAVNGPAAPPEAPVPVE